jgi:hypothetical protein
MSEPFLGIKYRGAPLVLKTSCYGVVRRSETGAIYQRFKLEGIASAVEAYALNLGYGNSAEIENDGPMSTLTIDVGLSATDAKWEIDTENLEQDILNAPFLYPPSPKVAITAQARTAFINWKNQGNLTNASIAPAPGDPAFSASDNSYLASLQSLFLAGVETSPVNSTILKLTATVPITMFVDDASGNPAQLNINTNPLITYSTDQIVSLYGFTMYPGLSNQIPGRTDGSVSYPSTPNPTACNGTWGWRPRLSNATFVGRGMVEITNDWVLACWSNLLYTPSTL